MSSNRIRRVMASAIAAGMLFAIVPAATFAQDEGSSIVPAGLNADRIDGKHAVGAKAAKGKRAGKLVATDKKGFLPSNIVKPKWGYIKNKPAAFKDGRIGWNEVVNRPTTVVQNVVITMKTDQISVAEGTDSSLDVICPAGTKVIAGGFGQNPSGLNITDSYAVPDGTVGEPVTNLWRVFASNPVDAGPTETLFVDATCLSTPGVAIAFKGKGGILASSKRRK